MNRKILLFNLIILCFGSAIAENKNIWLEVEKPTSTLINVTDGKYYNLDFEEIKSFLDKAPFENIPHGFTSNFKIELPMPDGNIESFLIHRTRLMEEGLANKFPGIKTFSGYSTISNLKRITLDYTYKGFHAKIDYPGESVFIDPINLDTKTEYVVYTKSDFYKSNSSDYIEYDVVYPEGLEINLPDNDELQIPIGDELNTYRLAMSTTGEYSTFHGGTVNGVLSAVQTTVARVNSVYEVELAVRLILINNTDTLFQFDPNNDPFSNYNGGALLGENQTEIDNKIGTANYDIGHIFSTGGGGIASYASVCTSQKAQGVTGSDSPIGDPFDIDYVAHEIGHQFSGSHTFDGSGGSCGGNRSSSTAYEPGSGSTIMGYAGICGGDNIQNNSDAFFHVGSYVEMTNFIHNGFGKSCATITPTGNTQPQAEANPITDYHVIPMETPFELTGEGSDPDGDDITYIWEEYDRTSSGSSVNNPGPNSPLFRSWTPETDGFVRTFPRMFNILNNGTVKGETYPFSNRIMKFRLTVRDNKLAGGGVDWDETEVEVTTDAGPFYITYPDSLGHSLEASDNNAIRWNVANTNTGAVNTEFVNIYLSIDNGSNFDILLAENVENDGYYNLVLDDTYAGKTNCRLMIKAVGNIFFHVSSQKFSITAFDGIENTDFTSIESIKDQKISLYPNPASDVINISSVETVKNVTVTDILGKQLIQNTNSNLKNIDISILENGVYFINVTTISGENHTERIIKN